MRVIFALIVSVFLSMATAPAWAGSIATVGGKPQWIPASCKEPVPPASLFAAGAETPANNMNSLAAQYNDYAKKMQDYMNCVSKEAEDDETANNQIITQSAQATIDAAQKKVAVLHDGVQKKQQD